MYILNFRVDIYWSTLFFYVVKKYFIIIICCQSLVLTHKDKLCSLTISQNYDISKLEDKYKYIMIAGTESKLIPLWQIELYNRITLSLVRQVSDNFCVYQFIIIDSNIITYDARYIKGFEDTGLTVYGIY